MSYDPTAEFVYIVYNHACDQLIGASLTLENAKMLCPMPNVMEDSCICVHRVHLNLPHDDRDALSQESVVYPV